MLSSRRCDTHRCRYSLGFLIGLALASGQSLPFELRAELEPGLRTFTFQTADGTVRVFLPDEIHPGDEIAGTAEVVHALSSWVRDYRVDFAGELSKIGLFRRKIGVDGTLRLRNPNGQLVASAVIPMDEAPKPRPPASKAFPEYLQEGGTAIVPATWPGVAIAKGADFAVIRVPAQGIGATARMLRVELKGIPPALANGKRAALTLTVAGLKGIDRDVPIHIENRAPSITRLYDPKDELIWIRPGDVDREGRFTRKLQLTGIQAGEIRIAARVMVPRDRVEEVSLVLRSSDPSVAALKELPYDAFQPLAELLDGNLGYAAANRLFELDAIHALPLALASKNHGVYTYGLERFLDRYSKGDRLHTEQAHAAAVRSLAASRSIPALKVLSVTGNAADFPLLEKFSLSADYEELAFTAIAALARMGSKPHLEQLRDGLISQRTVREFQAALRLSRMLDAAGIAGNRELIEAVCPHVWAGEVNAGDMIAAPSLSAAGALAAITTGKLPDILLPYSISREHWQEFCKSRGAGPK